MIDKIITETDITATKRAKVELSGNLQKTQQTFFLVLCFSCLELMKARFSIWLRHESWRFFVETTFGPLN